MAMMDWWTILLIWFGIWFVSKCNIDADRRRRELDELRDRRAELEVQQRVLLGALERLRSMK
jgi:hypothetical protein